MEFILPFGENFTNKQGVQQQLARGRDIVSFVKKLDDIEPSYFSPDNWRFDNFKNLHTNWVLFYVGENINDESVADKFNIITERYFNELKSVSNLKDFLQLHGLNNSVILHNIFIDISRFKQILTHSTESGKHYQLYSDGDYEITIEGRIQNLTQSFPDYRKLSHLNNLLSYPIELNILSPELNKIYDIDKAQITGFNITQSSSYYNIKNVKIRMKPNFDKKIISTDAYN